MKFFLIVFEFRFVITFLCTLFLQSIYVNAVSFDHLSVDQLYDKSKVVAKIRIVKAKYLKNSNEDENSCGIDYEAHIIYSFKGMDEKIIKFRSYNSLNIGKMYVAFLSEYYFSAEAKDLMMENNEIEFYETCINNSPNLYASSTYGELYEFDLLSEIFNNEQWVKSNSYHIIIPENITVNNVNYTSDDVSNDYVMSLEHRLIKWEEFEFYLKSLAINKSN